MGVTGGRVIGRNWGQTTFNCDQMWALGQPKNKRGLSPIFRYFPKGIITVVTAFGLFVELQAMFVEGLVHVTALRNDYYHFDPIGHRLRGERSGQVYRLGDTLRVRVVRVDLDERKIDFELGVST